MSQFKIYGQRQLIEAKRAELSNAIHAASVGELGLPEAKRFHRFIALDAEDFIAPPDRTANYVIIEVHMFNGRPVEVKKAFYSAVLANLKALGIEANDVEITLIESPRENWSIRGLPGDELTLSYKVGDEP